MITLRPAKERGHANHGWLDSWHSFSFADYYDQAHVHWGPLRVINEDRVAPGAGFGLHPHRDMEILTFVVDGTLDHTDRIGNGHRESLRYGEVQRISAGTGMTHSEFNGSRSEKVHLLQIWILPDRKGHTPRYEQRVFDPAARKNRLVAFAGPEGTPETAPGQIAMPIYQDAWMFGTILTQGAGVSREIGDGRAAWVQLVRGSIKVNGETLMPGDAAILENEGTLTIVGDAAESEALVFDVM